MVIHVFIIKPCEQRQLITCENVSLLSSFLEKTAEIKSKYNVIYYWTDVY